MGISPRWSGTTKFLVALAVLAIVAFLLLRFQALIAPVILAVILAYLLNPIVTAVAKITRLSRSLAVLGVYAILILLLLAIVSGAGLLIQQQFSGVLSTALAFINSIPPWVTSLSVKPVHLGPLTLDLSTTNATALQNELIPTARDWIGRITSWMTGAASEAATTVAWAGFVFIISYYLIHDMKAIEKEVLRLFPDEYQRDAQRLLAALGPIWNAFLRGQLTLSLIMGLAFALVMSLLGLRYALIIGLMAALMEFVPIIGPYLTAGTAILIAFFQPVNWMGFSPTAYTLTVAAAALLLQQLEANFLSPRVMGRQLRMHPAILIVGAFIGASLMGIPGLLLSGPILASSRLFGRYIRAKLFNQPPWPELEEGRPIAIKTNPVFCREVRDADKPDVLDLTARMWEGHDYIPQVWNDWLADRTGIFAAAETDGKVVGIGKLTRLAAGEWWIEGLRVHPEYQGMKISSKLFKYLLEKWRERGGGTIRLATSSERLPVHHLCGRFGFRHTESLILMTSKPIERGESAFELIAEEDGPAAQAFSNSHGAVRSYPGLINTGWRWSRLTEERIGEFIRRGRAWWWKNRSAVLMLYDAEHENMPSLEIAAVLSSAADLAAILGQARRLAGKAGAERLAWAMPDLPAAVQAARQAGFKQDWDAQLWIFERSDLEAAEPSAESARVEEARPIETGRTSA